MPCETNTAAMCCQNGACQNSRQGLKTQLEAAPMRSGAGALGLEPRPVGIRCAAAAVGRLKEAAGAAGLTPYRSSRSNRPCPCPCPGNPATEAEGPVEGLVDVGGCNPSSIAKGSATTAGVSQANLLLLLRKHAGGCHKRTCLMLLFMQHSQLIALQR